MSKDRQAVNLLIKGRVQGVGFRWRVKQQAKQSGIAGWVKNLPNGQVEAMVCASKEEIDSFLNWLLSDSGFEITDCQVNNMELDDFSEDFKIIK